MKKYNLVFLQIGTPLPINAFLQHIQALYYIDLSKGDTYNILFDKLRKRFENDKDKLSEVESWIQFNLNDQEDQSVFDSVIVKDDGLCAMFDFQTN